jgi:hypothetical protein
MLRKFFITLLVFSYNLAKDRRPSYPFITGDGFRALAQHILDEEQTFNPLDVSYKDIIFVGTAYLPFFFNTFLPQISQKIVLISHNHDDPITNIYQPYIVNKKIIHWFAQNVDEWTHPKLTPIPIGIENRYNPCGQFIDNVAPFIQKYSQNKDRATAIYANFRAITHPERSHVQQLLGTHPLATWVPRKNFGEYLADLSKSIFTLSPRGHGLDCHRTWEALLMGSYPIVRTSTLDPLYKDLPVVILNKWKDLTKEYLEKKIAEFKNRTFNREKCYFDYWQELIKKTQENS